MNRRMRRTETGFTLIELIISMTLLATITGALVATFITTNNANANTSERIHESNDAQLTAGFWTADAQAAGGIDPLRGATDPTLGVLAPTDNGNCALGSGTEVIGFKWREWASRDAITRGDSYTTRVAVYVYRSATQELERRTCANNALTSVTTLATRVVAAPSTSCAPTANCPGLPKTVTIIVAETNQPSTGAQYQFTLTANVRSDAQTARDSTNSQSSPLLVLGGSCSAGYGFHMQGGTGFHMIVNGDVVINTTDGPGCTAMSANGSPNYEANSTAIASGGSCPGGGCPAYAGSSAFGNPFASLTPPSTSGCGSGSNPAAVGGVYQPGVYPQTLVLSGSQSLAPVTAAQPAYVLCNGISGSSTTRSTGVFLYVAGGTITATNLLLSAPATGTYANVAMWNATTNDWNVHQATINIEGAYYSPNAGLINANGVTSVTIGVLIVKYVDFGGSSTVTVTGTGTPRSPILTATTGAALRTVNLSWVPQSFPGMSPITSYDYRADRGGGVFGAWTAIAGGAATTTLVDTCATSNTVATTCYYQVRAINAVGTGSPSNIANAGSAFDAIAPAVAINAPANNSRTGLSTTISGTAGNVAGDSPTVVVSLYSGANCVGTVQTFNVARTGATWSVPTGVMTAGATSVCATQADTAGNTGFAGPINFTAGHVTNLVVTNGGTVGKIDKSDAVVITFGQAMNPATLCTGWNGTTARKSSTVIVVVKNNDPATNGNDSLTVTDTLCPTFNLGKVDLGTTTWVNADTNFSDSNATKASSVVFDGTKTILTITLGTGSGSGANVAAQTMTYTPVAAMKDSAGNAMAGSYTFAGLRF